MGVFTDNRTGEVEITSPISVATTVITNTVGDPVDVTGGALHVLVDGIAFSQVQASGTVTNVPDNTKTTIITKTYSVGAFENVAIVSCSGGDYAKFYLTLNGTDIDIRRSGPSRNVEFNLTGAPLALSSGDIIDVKVEHFVGLALLDFDATLYGYA